MRYRYPGPAVKPKWKNRTTSHRGLGILEPGKVQDGPEAAVLKAAKGGLVELTEQQDKAVLQAALEQERRKAKADQAGPAAASAAASNAAAPPPADGDETAAAPEAARTGRGARGRQ